MKLTLILLIFLFTSCLRDQKIDSLIQAQEYQKECYKESLFKVYKQGLEDAYYTMFLTLHQRNIFDSLTNNQLDIIELDLKLKIDSLSRKFEKD